MKMSRKIILSIASLFLFTLAVPHILHAQAGSSGLSFLKIGVGARTMGMGDAGAANADMGSAMYYNPALIADDEHASVTIMHNEWIEEITTDFVGVSVPMKGWSLGIHMGLTSVGGIEVRDRPGEAITDTDNRNFAGGITAAVPLFEGLDVGVTAKYVFEKIHVEEAGGYAFDFGFAMQPFSDGDLSRLRLGVALANVGSMSELSSVPTTLPMLLRYGASYHIPLFEINGSLRLAAEGVSLLEDDITHANVGMEFEYFDTVFLRLGYQSGYENKDVTLGAGARYGVLRFDYAFIPFTEVFGNAHTVALSIAL
jgi:hypothetical protein